MGDRTASLYAEGDEEKVLGWVVQATQARALAFRAPRPAARIGVLGEWWRRASVRDILGGLRIGRLIGLAPRLDSDSIVGVGTGSTANFFIDMLAELKTEFDGAVASSEATAERHEQHPAGGGWGIGAIGFLLQACH